MSAQRFVFLGAGNMAEALLRGLLGAGIPAAAITVTDVRPERLQELSHEFGVHGLSDNRKAVCDADVVFLAVKPAVAGAVLAEVSAVWPPHAVLVSIVAGLPTARIESALGAEPRVIRAMPNTPALVGAGATAYCGGRWTRATDLEAAQTWLGGVGVAMASEERHMDAVTALSGSGPAYVCVLVEAMLAAAQEMGLPPDTARTLALQTIVGAGRMLETTGADPAEARARVTSKGGTTEAALKILFEHDVPEVWRRAILAARDRSRELSRG